jgi:hypothetical protein
MVIFCVINLIEHYTPGKEQCHNLIFKFILRLFKFSKAVERKLRIIEVCYRLFKINNSFLCYCYYCYYWNNKLFIL